MLILSKELQAAVRTSGDRPLRVVDPDTRTEYVLVAADVFDRLADAEFGKPLTREEQLGLLIAAGKRAGWDDPVMDVYDDLDPRRP